MTECGPTDIHFVRWNNISILSNTELRLLFSVTLILCFVCELRISNLILNGTILMGQCFHSSNTECDVIESVFIAYKYAVI